MPVLNLYDGDRIVQKEIEDVPSVARLSNAQAHRDALIREADALEAKLQSKIDAKSAQLRELQRHFDTLNAKIDAAQKAADEKIVRELVAHTTEMDKRTADLNVRERQVAKREAQVEDLLERLKADRVKLDKKLALLAAD